MVVVCKFTRQRRASSCEYSLCDRCVSIIVFLRVFLALESNKNISAKQKLVHKIWQFRGVYCVFWLKISPFCMGQAICVYLTEKMTQIMTHLIADLSPFRETISQHCPSMTISDFFLWFDGSSIETLALFLTRRTIWHTHKSSIGIYWTIFTDLSMKSLILNDSFANKFGSYVCVRFVLLLCESTLTVFVL